MKQVILSFRNRSCRYRVSVPEGIVAERVEDILSDRRQIVLCRKHIELAHDCAD
jgi:hypothetical protein